MIIKKSKFYEVNIRRGTIGKEYNRAKDVPVSRDVIAVKGSDLLTATTFQYFIPGEVR